MSSQEVQFSLYIPLYSRAHQGCQTALCADNIGFLHVFFSFVVIIECLFKKSSSLYILQCSWAHQRLPDSCVDVQSCETIWVLNSLNTHLLTCHYHLFDTAATQRRSEGYAVGTSATGPQIGRDLWGAKLMKIMKLNNLNKKGDTHLIICPRTQNILATGLVALTFR